MERSDDKRNQAKQEDALLLKQQQEPVRKLLKTKPSILVFQIKCILLRIAMETLSSMIYHLIKVL